MNKNRVQEIEEKIADLKANWKNNLSGLKKNRPNKSCVSGNGWD
jgi:hypothetical protein